MALIFVAEQLVGIDGISATMSPAEGHSSGDWAPGWGGNLGPTTFTVGVSDPSMGRWLELGTDGAAYVSYNISNSSPLAGRFFLASSDGADQITAEGWGDSWRIDYGSDGSQCSGYHAAPIECYALGRWVEEAALSVASVAEPAGLFVAMLAAMALRTMASARPLTRRRPC